jgi:hypothetical protein
VADASVEVLAGAQCLTSCAACCGGDGTRHPRGMSARVGPSFSPRVVIRRPSYFSRLFKRSTGLSPHQYLLRQRIERARCELHRRHVRSRTPSDHGRHHRHQVR